MWTMLVYANQLRLKVLRFMVAHGSWLRRSLAWLLMAMLVLQLFGLGQHHHAIDSHRSDCASCFAGSVAPADQPLAPPALLPLRQAGSHLLLPAVRPARPVLRSFLIPHAHGPPAPLC